MSVEFDVIVRFLKFVDQNGPMILESQCWEWTASIKAKEYGSFWFNNKCILAHRVSYELFKGVSPGGMQVMHRCDNMKCVNPAHLSLGTNRDNQIDSIKKGRGGHQKLKSEETIKEIVNLYMTGNYTQKEIGKMFGVSRGVISNIICETRHKYIGPLNLRVKPNEQYRRTKHQILMPDQAKQIRELYATGQYTQKEIGEMFGVHRKTISDIILKKTWTHIPRSFHPANNQQPS